MANEVNRVDTLKKTLLTALGRSLGNVSDACKKANISRTYFYELKNEDPEFFQAVEDISESALDLTETALLRQIQDGNMTGIIFMLKTRGRKRGFIEVVEQQHSGKDGGAIQFENISLEKRIEALKLLEGDDG